MNMSWGHTVTIESSSHWGQSIIFPVSVAVLAQTPLDLVKIFFTAILLVMRPFYHVGDWGGPSVLQQYWCGLTQSISPSCSWSWCWFSSQLWDATHNSHLGGQLTSIVPGLHCGEYYQYNTVTSCVTVALHRCILTTYICNVKQYTIFIVMYFYFYIGIWSLKCELTIMSNLLFL